MKKIFLTYGLFMVAQMSIAQQHNYQVKSGKNFGFSVFHYSHKLMPVHRADTASYAKLSAMFPGWYIETDDWTGGFNELNGRPLVVSGASLEEKAKFLMDNQLSSSGLKSSEWKLDEIKVTQKNLTYLYYHQEIAGKKVAFAKLHFKFTPDGKIVRINMSGYGNADISLSPAISASAAIDIAVSGLDGAIITSKKIDDNWEWFPIPSATGYSLHPAYRFSVEGKMQDATINGGMPLNVIGYVDATTGQLLYRSNQTMDAIDLKMVGSIYTDGINNPTKKVGLPYVTFKNGSTTLLANDTGFVSSMAFSLPSTFTVSLEGPWSKVKSVPDASITPSFNKTISTLGLTDSFPSSSKSTSRHINAYYHVNTVHDFMKKNYGARFTGMDYALETNVDIARTCNAYYDPSGATSINFYPEGGGCVSFAEVKDVVYHEYGHAILDKMYSTSFINGALHEGQADVWAMSITKDSILARGFLSGDPTSFIRRYDVSPKVYPNDLVGEVHRDGEIIAGAWWDYARNVGSYDTMSRLFSETLITDKPNGPNGTEGKVYYDILMSALTNDDNDFDLSNGTPHFTQIVKAFAKHGINLLRDVSITHTELAHQPSATKIKVNASLTTSKPVFFQKLYLMYRNSRSAGAVWDTITMVDAGGLNFSAEIPAQIPGTILDYYFAVEDIANATGIFFPQNYLPLSVSPEDKVTLPYQFGVGISAMKVFNFETPLSSDWQLGLPTDNALAGEWIQAVPIASFEGTEECQTGNDHTSGAGKCLVTGNAPNERFSPLEASVRSGTTTILTPMFDLADFTNPIFEYYRWYGNDLRDLPKANYWLVKLSSPSSGISRIVENTNQSDYQWRRKLFRAFDYFPSATQVQLSFIAKEAPDGADIGLVEAAVDDLVIYEGVEGVAGIPEVTKELANIYPNPSIGKLNIVLPSYTYKELSISFYDLKGSLISTVPVTNGATHYSVATGNMVPGQYLVVIRMDKTIQTHKITIAGY